LDDTLNSFRFSAGKPTSLVIDVGASMVSVTPVIDGMIIKKGELSANDGN
jgi:actin-related protein